MEAVKGVSYRLFWKGLRIGNEAFVLKHPSPPEFRMASQVSSLVVLGTHAVSSVVEAHRETHADKTIPRSTWRGGGGF
jgi:hypothetical protein